MRVATLVVLAACSAGDDVHSPLLSSVTPDHGVGGTIVMIAGNYFCGQPETDPDDVDPLACDTLGFVHFGSVQATPLQYTDTAIAAEVPPGNSGSVRLSVSVAGRTSNAIPFTVE